MIDIAKNMISENSLCVLSTCSNDLPNTSLMKYICDESCTKLYMITLKGSIKYQNIAANPNVSLLIDTRDQISNLSEPIKSLTVYGKARVVENFQSHQELLSRIVSRHKNLIPISENSNCAVIEFIAEKFLLLDGVDESIYMEV